MDKEVYIGMDDQFGNWEFIQDLLGVNVYDRKEERCDGES